MIKISIIIPAFNEADNIAKLVKHLIANSDNAITDIIVADGGSSDDTIRMANNAGAFAILSPVKGRAAQMNYAAGFAKGDVLYFIHADCFPPSHFVNDIRQAIADGYDMGRYRTKFDSGKTMLKINQWFTRFDLFICMGGDQTLFIKRMLFEKCNGFDESMKIMEEKSLVMLSAFIKKTGKV